MRKLNYFIVLLLVFCAFSLNVNARTAKIPDVIPSVNDVLQGVTDEEYDFSSIEFATLPEGEYIPGSAYMEKIMLYEEKGDGLGSGEYSGYLNAFTAYCLNHNKIYPDFYIINDYTGVSLFKNYATSAVLEDPAFKSLFDNIEKFEIMDSTTGISDPSQTDLDNFIAGQTVTAHVMRIAFQWENGDKAYITAEDLIEAKGGTYNEGDLYDVTFSIKSYLANSFVTKSMPDNTYFNRALWIIEHSYPTLTIEESLNAAGANYQTLLVELASIFPEATSTELAKIAENYIYGTVQYAIWKAEDTFVSTIDGSAYKLGNSLRGSTQLNLLYKYLIKDRKVYVTYGSEDFKNSLDVNKPKNELYKETKSAYMYGPYTVKSSLLSIGDANVSIANKDKTGISIVNKNGDEISSVTNEEEFYIKVTKASKVASVNLTISTSNGIKFDPESNRGRIYEPKAVLYQNVASGGIAVAATVSNEIELVYNPKTGVEDVGLILLIALGAFVIGYLALSFKSKPLEI